MCHIFVLQVKKQNLERIRRANIADKISTMHSLALEMVGEKVRECSIVLTSDQFSNQVKLLVSHL